MSGESGAKRDRYGLRLSGIPDYWDLSLRVRNRLESQGIETLEGLLRTSDDKLLRIPHFGVKCLSEVADFIKKVENGRGLGPLRSPSVLDKIRRASLGFEGLDDLTRECLEEAGITDGPTLFERSVSEILEALAYDPECLHALWTCCGLPRPTDANELLALLCMLNAPLHIADVLADVSREEYMDSLGRCLKLVREQVGNDTLHPQALMNYTPLQLPNELLKPPAKNMVETLELAERDAIVLPQAALDALEESLQPSALVDDLNQLLDILSEKETLVLRRRYATFRETLQSVADEVEGVSRERVRQIQVAARAKLAGIYENTLPLPRLRSAMLFVSQAKAYSAREMTDVLCSRGLIREDEEIDDFLAVWRVLEGEGSSVSDHLHDWRVLDREAYRFPFEEIRSVFSTGLTRVQADLAERLMPLVRRRCAREGFFLRTEVLRDAFGDDLPDGEDLRHVLGENDCSHVIGDYWTGPSSGRDVPDNVFRKMLQYCGPLDISAIHTGLARHQRREGYASPPLEVLEAMLGRRDYVKILEDGRFALLPGEDAPDLYRMERTWLNLAEKHGPVLTHGQIADEFRRQGLSRVGAAQLCATSDLVMQLTRNRYSLPGRVPDSLLPVESPLLEVDGAERSGEYTGPLDIVQARLVVGTSAPYSPRLHLPESRWPGKVDVVFDWQGEEVRVRTSYVASEDVTIAGPQDFTLKRTVWNRFGTLRSGDLFTRVAVPPPPESRSLVFLFWEGRRVKNWRGGREHLVFVYEDAFDADRAGLLFGDFRILASPPGWEEYRLLRAGIERVGEGATPETLDDAAREMGLPGFGTLYRVRAKLLGTPAVGSGAPPRGVPEFEEYPVSRPPVLELYGLWHGAVRVDLYAVDTAGETGYEETKLDSLEIESNGRSRIIELLDHPGPGLYRVRVEGCEDMIFRTASHSDGEVDVAGLDLRLRAGSGGENARLTVRAWPGVKLALSVTCGVAWRRYATLRTDGSGLWEGTLSDLGVSGVPEEGRLEASISWKGLLTRRAVLRESRLGAGNRFEWSEVSGERVLALRVPEEGDALDALGDETYIVGERPWLGEIWEPVVRGVPGGGTAVVVPGAVGPAWSVEISDSQPIEVAVNPVDGRRSPAERWFGLGDVLGDEDPPGTERWRRVSGALRERSLSPALRKRLGVGELRRTLSESIAEFPTAARWLPLTPELQSRLHELSRYGLRPTVVAFVPGKEPEGEQGVKGLSSVLSAEISHLAETGESALLYLERDGRSRKTANRVLAPETVPDGRSNYLIEAGEHLSACLGCGLYMPSKDFEYHGAIVAARRTCGGSGRSFRMISPGVRCDVVLAVHLDPEQLPAVFEEIVHRAVAGEDIPDFAEPWMGRIVEVFNADAVETDEPERWFARARECLLGAGVLLERLGSGRIRETELADYGWSSVPYRGAMKVMSDWTRDEMEGR